ncbi:aryl-sulfate sulfotransferase [Spongiimicrobium sp. 3-5]|uniref:aryl-sulfate sulfotransferase n=1 Tax=Spongiimicrobium sp. 3-5 TaxID=3332596 RepID=UPI0039813CB5
MIHKTFRLLCVSLVLVSLFISCSDDESPLPDEDATEIEMEEEEEEEEEPPIEAEPPGTVEFFNESLTEDGLILVNDPGNKRAYLMDRNANITHEWKLKGAPGNDMLLLPDGKLLASLKVEDPAIPFGGLGGVVQLINPDNTLDWDFFYSSEDYIIHHDVELLPNGNVLALVWERKTVEEAENAGSNLTIDVFPEAIIEINPTTDEIEWEWHAWDHLIQDHDNTKENFGVVADNPQLIDLNHVDIDDGDIMHANGFSYDEINDIIYLSVNFFSEVWVIDHSTTTEEAKTSSGGNFGKGGDLLYRFGNPSAYDNNMGERLFFNNHFPNLLKGSVSGAGNILIFVNRMNDTDQSAVYELKMPTTFDLQPNTNNEPEIVWSFTNEELYSPKVSGAVRLKNGNTLITQGTGDPGGGFWEVTSDGEVVWRFTGVGFFWRGYNYDKNAPEVLALTN